MNALLVEDLNVHYGTIHAVQGVSFSVNEGEIVSIVGSNGAGKSTIMWTLAGVVPPSGGRVLIKGNPLPSKPHEIVARGLALVPERRRLFSALTVRENLIMGAYRRRDEESVKAEMERCFQLFPILRERLGQRSGTLSGGEQQMLAISRALMSDPKILLLDEPTLGLAPLIVEAVMNTIIRIRDEGVTVLMVEQNATQALEISDRGYILEAGLFVKTGPGPDLAMDPEIRRAYLGG
ncbi:MAG TPA: ABC transporter ATP-binding protein [Synergistales bacterium]|nr:branched-chain amino acid ABC transporter ATP-binding protein [Synergistaceae bacterium]HPA58351.1 ABC transporter ATP-binding protein [Synergistales bacterium]HQO83149.1 ABC transporter ATP-binding protein [Synergistales bacterium]HQQ10967.1 ABC transporter ATP-binding protein [Synergistales bacterium]